MLFELYSVLLFLFPRRGQLRNEMLYQSAYFSHEIFHLTMNSSSSTTSDIQVARSKRTNSRKGRKKLTAFLWCGAIALCLLAHLALGFWQYSYHRQAQFAARVTNLKLLIEQAAESQQLIFGEPDSIVRFSDHLAEKRSLERVHLFDQVDQIGGDSILDASADIYRLHKDLIELPELLIAVQDEPHMSSRWLKSVIAPRAFTLRAAVKVEDRVQAQGVVVASIDVQQELRAALKTTLHFFAATSMVSMLIIFLLVTLMRRRRKIVQPKHKGTGRQIARLQELLDLARAHQHSMRTASSHAVELNEQFLRKVGSDLHDGPAQSMSYAILRLNEQKEELMKHDLGAEHCSIIESLESALSEIRGISKGLFLPQLEKLSLEMCLRKVVDLHRELHDDIDIREHYVNLPEEIDFGMKICIYRFVQEGLNNAARHSKATRCRVSASFEGSELKVSLKDDGMGFRVSKLTTEDNRLGVIGLKDRIESLGGEFKINSVLGIGTALKLVIVLPELKDEDSQ